MCDILKTSGHGARWSEMWDSGTLVTHTGGIWYILDLAVCSRSFWDHSVYLSQNGL